MEGKLLKGDNYKRFKKGSKPEYSNSGPENFVHPLSKFLDPPLGRRNIFMTKSPQKNALDVEIELGAACMPSELASDRATAPGWLIWAFADHLCDNYHNLMSWLIYPFKFYPQ